MADEKVLALLVIVALTGLAGCGSHDERPKPSEHATPAPKIPPEPAPRGRKQSAEPLPSDPSTKPPVGYRRMAMGGVAPGHTGSAIVLVDEDGRRGLLLTGAGVASSPLAIHLAHFGAEDRSGHALLAAAVHKLGGSILSVRVDRLEDQVLYASILLQSGGKRFQLDARPSDALSLAVESDVPVFVAESVLAHAGVDLDKFDFRRLRTTPSKERDEVAL